MPVAPKTLHLKPINGQRLSKKTRVIEPKSSVVGAEGRHDFKAKKKPEG